MSWPDIHTHAARWLNEVVLPKVLENNRTRVLRAIPQPPTYNIAQICDAVWVLESDADGKQGTAFALDDLGLVTCEHVLGKNTRAFRWDKPEKSYAVSVKKKHAVVDLAVLTLDIPIGSSLRRGSPDEAKQMDHILVAGHPNYRKGDSPVVVPGLIVGFRPVSGVRRFLTNAPIVAGSSGGPVLDATHRVVGVAVTGADRFDATRETEDLSIIPINALELL